MSDLRNPLTYAHYIALALVLMLFHLFIGMNIILMGVIYGAWFMLIVYFAAFTVVLAAADILWHRYVSD